MFGTRSEWLRVTAVVSAILLVPTDVPLPAQAPQSQPAAPKQDPDAPKTPDQLDSLVAPIALYPDPLLGQVLAASTYPLEIVEANRWLKSNTTLKGEERTNAAAKQPWDASVQALVAFPDALKFLDDNIQWTTDLGNAFLDQQGDVMDAVQRMRKKAKDGGKLEATKEQKVEVKTVETKTVIEIQPSNPEVIYVPSYNPTVVYGPPVYPYYPYPPIVYPAPVYTAGAVVATAAISFGVGVAMGAFWRGCCHGGYGWGCGWGSHNVTINNNFNTRYGYNNVNNINGGNRINSGNSNWQHNPAHRDSVPYGNRNTAQRFGGSARDANGGLQRFDRNGQARNNGIGNRGGVGDRGGVGNNRGGVGDRGGVGGGGGVGNRGDVSGNRAGAGQDRVGNRSVGNQGAGQSSAFGGSDSRARTEASSNRGFSSSRSSSGGGFSGARSGGGGYRGGGGGRRR
jgi:hypothetical protein